MRLLILIFCLFLPALAAAQDAPRRAPTPDWVEALPIPAPDPALADRPFQMLLVSNQSRYGSDHHDHYSELAMIAQNAQGVQGLGNIQLPWQPDQSELIVHRVEIRRGDRVINLLTGERQFTVLRRENNLESAMLDGVLTAVMQAEGFSVGDVLHVAFTTRQRGGAMPLRAENMVFIAPDARARRFHFRQIWPSAMPIRWRGTGQLADGQLRTTAAGTELRLDLSDVEGVAPPENAPPRFNLPATLQLTEFRDWAEVSREFAPLYEQASTIGADSPLRAEIERIAAASPDPRRRMLAALRLVQEEVRYLALVMGDGNYVPATAEQTWARRYGDCKAKTALLLALLRGLGIEAEAVAVNATVGDGLNELLPQRRDFDHVIVRARIDGRSYWLDGTRIGDRDLESLASSRLGWGLPLRAAGATLEQIPFAPAELPLVESRITYDASRGLLGTVPATGEMVFRRDVAAMLRITAAQQGQEAFNETLRNMAGEYVDGSDAQISHDYDDETGEFVLRVSGSRRLNWSGSSSSRSILYQFNGETIDWNPDFEREDARLRDAPFSLAALIDHQLIETVILPRDIAFTLQARPIDRVVAGVHLSRTVTLEDGRAVARMAFRPQQLEIPAAEARASLAALREIAGSRAIVRGEARELSRADRRELRSQGDQQPAGAGALLDRGYNHLQAGNLDAAEADFREAARVAPESSRALANLAIVMINRGDLEEAETFLARADALRRDDFVSYQARGLIQMERNRPVQAVAAFTQSLALDENNVFTLYQRAVAYLRLGEVEDALADLQEVIRHQPNHRGALFTRARVHASRSEPDRAVAAADELLSADPGDPALIYTRATILRRLGRDEEAARGFAAALAALDARIAADPSQELGLAGVRRTILRDNGEIGRAIELMDVAIAADPDDILLLNERCWARAIRNVELSAALADCDRAIATAPTAAAILDSRALVKLRLGDLDGAIADASAALEQSPTMAPALYVRGVARLRRGEREAGQQDLAAARRLRFDIEAEYREYGVAPEPPQS